MFWVLDIRIYCFIFDLENLRKKIFFLDFFFNFLLATLISQSTPVSISGIKVSKIYILSILVGFIISNWYSALLGSFFTTYIREPQISTIKELQESTIKILFHERESWNITFAYPEIKNKMVLVSWHEFLNYMRSKNVSFGFIAISDIWEIQEISEKYFLLKNFSMEKNFIRRYFDLNSIYKKPFNRYIGLIKDSGIYNYWKNRFYEDFALQQRNYSFITTENRRVLNINYFIYPISFLCVCCIISILVFILEIAYLPLSF